jgi:hypothetical protein
MDFAALLDAVRPPERTAFLCLREDLRAVHDQLQLELAKASRDAVTSLGGGAAGQDLAQRIRAIEADMDAAKVPFRFRALTPDAWSKLEDAHPAREGHDERQFNLDTFPPALIAASCVDPVMTEADVKQLFEKISSGQMGVLFDAAFLVNTGRAEVPFSALASAMTSGSGES